MCYILGLNACHSNSSACFLREGVLVAAVEEPRICNKIIGRKIILNATAEIKINGSEFI